MQSLVALLVAGFEIDSAEGGQYVPPPPTLPGEAVLMGPTKPKSDVEVHVRRRKGYESVEWNFEM